MTAITIVFLLTACSASPKRSGSDAASRDLYEARYDALSQLQKWSLSGKLSVDDGNDGGSGRLQWSVSDPVSDLSFRGALGKGAWRLHIEPGLAELRKADGSVVLANSVEQLVEAELGWTVPVHALRWWVLGVTAPGPVDLLEIDETGRAGYLEQFGWQVSFSRYDSEYGYDLPGRVDATRDQRRVKLAIASWQPASDDAE